MKFLIISSFLMLPFFAGNYLLTFSYAQQRGAKSIVVRIDGDDTELYKDSYALIIGISDYSNGWPKLPGVKKDIIAVKQTLEANGFAVTTAENLNKEAMDKAFSGFISKYGQGEGNRLLFYFAGHGHTVNTSYDDILGYIVPVDAPDPNKDNASFQSKSMEMAQIEIYAKRIQSKHALFLFDACFSGSLFALTRAIPSAISYKTTKPVRQFITSGSAEETVPDVSIFRKQFVEALSSDAADGNKDGYLTGNELGEYLQTNVTNYSYNAQHPQFGKIRNPNLDKGDFVFILPTKSKQPENENNNNGDAPVSKPSLGEAVPVQTYGSILITSEIGGDLYLDNVLLGTISADTKVPVEKVTTGSHKLEIRGNINWTRDVNVIQNQIVDIKAENPESVDYNFSSTSRDKVITEEENKTKNSSTEKVKSGTSANNKSAKMSSNDFSGESGSYTNPADGKTYRWVNIGGQVWMAENLDADMGDGSWCYNNSEDNCSKYGRLYDWQTAMQACPEGWHLPDNSEWKKMVNFFGGLSEAGDKLKEMQQQEHSFDVLFSGHKSNYAEFSGINESANYWTASEYEKSRAWSRSIRKNDPGVYNDYYHKSFGFSVRCIRDK